MIVKNVEKKEDNTLSFQVETDAAEFEAAVNRHEILFIIQTNSVAG